MTGYVLQVTVHLSKLFDNMSDLEFAKNEMLDNPRIVVGMYSKEREYVPLQTECCCYGLVRSHTKNLNLAFYNNNHNNHNLSNDNNILQ